MMSERVYGNGVNPKVANLVTVVKLGTDNKKVRILVNPCLTA